MNAFEKIKDRFVKVGNIQFSSHTKPLITVEDAIAIVNQVAEEYKEPTLTVEQLLRPNLNLKEFLKDAEECRNKYVGIEAYKQVAWERDIAIEQLHGLGYEFGEKIDKNDGWIPCSEQEEPNEYGQYIVYVQHYSNKDLFNETIAEWLGEWKINYNWNILAWQPLPAPYQPKGE